MTSYEPAHRDFLAVTGDTLICVQVAHPAGQVRAPGEANRFLQSRSIDALMIAADVTPADLPGFVAGLRGWGNLCGLSVTMPHKVAMARLVDELAPTAADAGTVNVVRRDPDGRLTGATFDGTGYVAGLRAQGHEVADRRVTVVGAGGVGRAVAFALARGGAARVNVVNRTRARGEELAADLADRTALADVHSVEVPAPDDDIVVNATSLGMDPSDPLPVDVGLLSPQTLVGEVVANPDVTPLLAAAEARGLAVHKGIQMMAPQFLEGARFMRLIP
ncbi:shikimate dehydrogenase family protein [Streptomyces fuscigenes]|uniref:shikimate dehydrogenase family protein n=1 Tax=Streptomyces fuscigenes TaxID=1528880 RepID=UPI001F363551|nr:shikimate dehydrogenase [Streptomyces fuscigenes]MCF3960850.1 shikimate dehydrogenase [Streptomyces fuscigenes]